MPCYRPLVGYRSLVPHEKTGKFPIVFSRSEMVAQAAKIGHGYAIRDREVQLPCGQCIHCRLEKSRQWAMRCFHESQMHENNCFITLTYDNEHLPKGYQLWRYNPFLEEYGWSDFHESPGSVNPRHPVEFMKRLRDFISRRAEKAKKPVPKIRSFGAMEYGELLLRPHYHICVFNYDFEDKKIWKNSRENPLYVSDDLQSLWTYGHSTVGALTFETAAYTARYVTKKITGERAEAHYESVDSKTGEVFRLLPEGPVCVSRGQGIGKSWYEKYGKQSRDNDFVVMRGVKLRPAKYYDKLFDVAEPEQFLQTKIRRRLSGQSAAEKMAAEDEVARRIYEAKGGYAQGNALPETRLTVTEYLHELKAIKLKRGFENGET